MYLPIALLVIGIVFLIIAMKMDNPDNLEKNEILNTLKSIESPKLELKEISNMIVNLEERIYNYEKKIAIYESSYQNLINEIQEIKNLKVPHFQPLRQEITEVHDNLQTSNKFQEVLELSQQGFSVGEIATRLSLSQDAVLLILNTTQRREPL